MYYTYRQRLSVSWEVFRETNGDHLRFFSSSKKIRSIETWNRHWPISWNYTVYVHSTWNSFRRRITRFIFISAKARSTRSRTILPTIVCSRVPLFVIRISSPKKPATNICRTKPNAPYSKQWTNWRSPSRIRWRVKPIVIMSSCVSFRPSASSRANWKKVSAAWSFVTVSDVHNHRQMPHFACQVFAYGNCVFFKPNWRWLFDWHPIQNRCLSESSWPTKVAIILISPCIEKWRTKRQDKLYSKHITLARQDLWMAELCTIPIWPRINCSTNASLHNRTVQHTSMICRKCFEELCSSPGDITSNWTEAKICRSLKIISPFKNWSSISFNKVKERPRRSLSEFPRIFCS